MSGRLDMEANRLYTAQKWKVLHLQNRFADRTSCHQIAQGDDQPKGEATAEMVCSRHDRLLLRTPIQHDCLISAYVIRYVAYSGIPGDMR